MLLLLWFCQNSVAKLFCKNEKTGKMFLIKG
uniref:Uncharacterized protein n=1 Tax=Arundo donax TaxID=35708 RepID=A0A0A9GMN2_ARUDO